MGQAKTFPEELVGIYGQSPSRDRHFTLKFKGTKTDSTSQQIEQSRVSGGDTSRYKSAFDLESFCLFFSFPMMIVASGRKTAIDCVKCDRWDGPA
jgi:hypothetical protein